MGFTSRLRPHANKMLYSFIAGSCVYQCYALFNGLTRSAALYRWCRNEKNFQSRDRTHYVVELLCLYDLRGSYEFKEGEWDAYAYSDEADAYVEKCADIRNP